MHKMIRTMIRKRKQTLPVPLIYLNGVLAAEGRMSREKLNLESLLPVIDKAFSIRKAPIVALSINSPGGSPTQSMLIADHLRRQGKARGKKIVAFCQDIAASGGYWLACAGDEIYAMPSSIVGSIGVVSGGFGFPKLLEKLGVERRIQTSGSNKGRFDMFQSSKQADVAKMKLVQEELHHEFVRFVRERRGKKLETPPKTSSGTSPKVAAGVASGTPAARRGRKSPSNNPRRAADESAFPYPFDGDFFLGKEALACGLIDGLGDRHTRLAELYPEHIIRWKPLNPPSRGGLRGLRGLWRMRQSPLEEMLGAVEDYLVWHRWML